MSYTSNICISVKPLPLFCNNKMLELEWLSLSHDRGLWQSSPSLQHASSRAISQPSGVLGREELLILFSEEHSQSWEDCSLLERSSPSDDLKRFLFSIHTYLLFSRGFAIQESVNSFVTESLRLSSQFHWVLSDVSPKLFKRKKNKSQNATFLGYIVSANRARSWKLQLTLHDSEISDEFFGGKCLIDEPCISSSMADFVFVSVKPLTVVFCGLDVFCAGNVCSVLLGDILGVFGLIEQSEQLHVRTPLFFGSKTCNWNYETR